MNWDSFWPSFAAALPALLAAIAAFSQALVNSRKATTAATAAVTAAEKAAVVENKLDHNTTMTSALSGKADTIVKQTNGSLETTKRMVESIADRVYKLEEYNHTSSHRVLDAINRLYLKVAELVALQPKPVVTTYPPAKDSP